VRRRAIDLWSAWWRSLLLGAIVELICLSGTVAAPTHRGRHADLVGAALIAIAAAAPVFARRRPAWALAAALLGTGSYLALGYATDTSFFIGLLVTAYRSAGASARGRGAIFMVATLAVFGVAALVARAGLNEWAWVVAVVVAAQVAGQVAAELGARSARQAAEVREEEARRRLAEERLRIARELHDVVSHTMAVINVQAGVAAHVIDQHPEQARQALQTIKSTSQSAMRDLRAILGLLRDDGDAEPLAPAPGLEAVPELVDGIRRAGVAVEVDLPEAEVAPGAAVTAYRVIQEALTNVVRHAPGARARVSVRPDGAALRIEIENDGVPTAPGTNGTGQGLAGMRERVRAAGGTLDARPRPEGGFVVRAVLPMGG
jgi:signal transduction histidine kinase